MAVISNSHTLLRGLNGDVPMGQMFVSGLEYSGDVITGYSGSAIGASSQDYSAGDNINITDHVISVTGLPPIDVEAPLYIVSDTPTGKIIGFSGEIDPNIDVINSTPGLVSGHYESGELTISAKDWENDIMGATANAAYVGSGLAVEWVTTQGYLTSHQDLSYISGKIDQNSADIYELSGKIKDYDVVGGSNTTVQTATAYGSTTFTVNTPDWSTAITAASANAADVASSVTTAWVTAQGYITSAPTATGTLSAVNNVTPSYVSGGYADGTLSLSGRDWTPTITAASAHAADLRVNNPTPAYVSAGYYKAIRMISVSGKDWTPDITAASSNATATTTAWVTSQGYITASKEYTGVSPIVVDNIGNTISADTAVLTAESPVYIETTTANGVEVNTIKLDGSAVGRTYTGVSPVIVDNTAGTIDISAYEVSGINIDITKDDANSAIIFSASPGGNSFNATVNGDTINYSGASSMRANFYNYDGRTAAGDWGYFNSITLYPEGGNTAYGNATFTFPDEFGFEGLIYRNGNQYKYIPFPYESAFHTSTSGLEMLGNDTKRTYFVSGPDTKFSINVPKHTTIELHYQGMMDVGNINSDTIMGFEFTNSPSTADTASNYLMATAEIILPTIKEVVTTASLGDTYNTYTAIDPPYYRRTYSTYMRYDNTSNYDQSLYMRVAPYIMGSQGWNTASWLKIGKPQPNDNIYYKLIPDFN